MYSRQTGSFSIRDSTRRQARRQLRWDRENTDCQLALEIPVGLRDDPQNFRDRDSWSVRQQQSTAALHQSPPAGRARLRLRENAGPDWTTTWRFSQATELHSSGLDFIGSVDVRGDTKDGRYFRLSIGTATNANQVLLFWHSGAANVQHRWVGLERLSQLPRLLRHASQSSHTSEGQK